MPLRRGRCQGAFRMRLDLTALPLLRSRVVGAEKDKEPEQPEAQDEEQPEPEGDETPEYRELEPGDLKRIREHRKWVKSDGKEGERADLTEAHLEGAQLLAAHLDLEHLQQAPFYSGSVPGLPDAQYLKVEMF